MPNDLSQSRLTATHSINGAACDAGTETASLNPATGEVVGRFPSGGRAEAQAAIAAARRAFDTGRWAQDPRSRQMVMLRWAEAMERDVAELAELLTRTNGKPLAAARAEIGAAVSEIRYYAGLARHNPGHAQEVAPGEISVVLRAYRGHLAVVTQTIPAIDEIYGENTRRALQGNAGIKLYLTPSDEKTVEELSKAVGKTTKTVVTRSRAVGKNPFEGRSQSERTEEVSLLPEDEARRLPLDEIIVVVDAQMPVRAKRVVYYEDPFFKGIHAAQEGELPFPKGPVGPMGELPLSVRAMPTAPRGNGLSERDFEARMGFTETGGNNPIDPSPAPVAGNSRAAVIAEDQLQFEMDFGGREALQFDSPTEADSEQVEDALSALDRLEGEIAGVSGSSEKPTERLVSG